jgi:TolB-like protein
MFNLRHTLRGTILCLAALYGASLAAQAELRIAVLEPICSKQTRAQSSLVRNALVQAASEARGFQVFDRVRTDQILKEHSFQQNGLVSANEARILGKMLGVDLICTSELQRLDDGYEVSAQMIDIVTGEIIGSKSELVESESSKDLRDASHELMNEMLKLASKKASTSLPKDAGRSGGSSKAGSSSAAQIIGGLDEDIVRSLKNFKSNVKWNKLKQTGDIEVDLSGLDIQLNRQYGEPYYVAQGRINISVTDVESGNEASVEIEIERVTEMNKDRMKKKIREQLHVGNTIKDLLSEME